MDSVDVKSSPPRIGVGERVSLIFKTGFSEIKRKGTVTRLNFEIKNLEKEKDEFLQALGLRAWEAHIDHPDLAAIIVRLKEFQIEMNRLKTQSGEHETQIKDIESSKTDLTTKFNQTLDQMEKLIAPHWQRIESIHAEKEDNKIQMEELRSKQDHLSNQIRRQQQNIQELDLGEDSEKISKIRQEQESIRAIHLDCSEIDCKLPFVMSKLEKLKAQLADERLVIQNLEQRKEAAKREFEQTLKDSNAQIHQLEEKKKQSSKQVDHFRREMEPFLYDLGSKVEQLRLQDAVLHDNYQHLDGINGEMEKRHKQIVEAESLSRAMDRAAWTQFLVFFGSVLLLFVSVVLILLH